jgi:Zn-finger nucleic acid-binding protein
LCQRVLDKAERCGIGVKVCSECQGVWLSQGQLEELTR